MKVAKALLASTRIVVWLIAFKISWTTRVRTERRKFRRMLEKNCIPEDLVRELEEEYSRKLHDIFPGLYSLMVARRSRDAVA